MIGVPAFFFFGIVNTAHAVDVHQPKLNGLFTDLRSERENLYTE